MLDPVWSRASPDAGSPFSVEVSPDHLAITTQVVGDGRDRPPPFFHCVYFHLFSVGPSGPRQLTGWGISMIDSGEIP